MTLVVNLVAGPGAGKSTTSAKVFSLLKERDINCELVREFAKDLSWIKDMKTLGDQYYVTGVQHYRQFMVDGEVDVMITDSPLIIGLLYYNESDPEIKHHFEQLVVKLFKKQNNLTYFLERKKKYNPKGRNQTKEEAVIKDLNSKYLLDNYEIPYKIIGGTSFAAKRIVNDILKHLKGK